MKKLLSIILFVLSFAATAFAQDDLYPAPENKGMFFIKNATLHVGNSQVIENATIQVNNGKIEKVGQDSKPRRVRAWNWRRVDANLPHRAPRGPAR